MTIKAEIGGHPEKKLGANLRVDRWWVGPALTVVGFTAFIVYSTWAAFQGNHYWHEGYLSPFYSPVLYVDPTAEGSIPIEHAWLGTWPDWWPGFLPASPAFLILMFPGAFRFTCYYYRKAYYRSFAGIPPACGVVGIPQNNYLGERGLMIFQNLHRYALYCALVFIVILAYDAYISFFREGEFGVGVGSIVLTINVLLLSSYTFGCHSFRHLIAGRLNCFSCDKASEARHGIWKFVSHLNQYHMQCAWISLFWVGFSDVYVRLISMGILTDYNTWS